MKIRTLIIDDEEAGRQTLKGYLTEYCPEIYIIKLVDSIQATIQAIKNHKPDLLFLDINLYGEESGFDIYDYLMDFKPEIIFVSAHEEHILKAFRKEAHDFLPKPVVISDLQKAVARVKQKIDARRRNEIIEKLSIQFLKFPIRKNPTTVKYVSLQQIIMIKAEGGLTNVYYEHENGEVKNDFILDSLKAIEEWLPKGIFFRSHNTFIVSLLHLQQFKSQNRKGKLLLTNNLVADVSQYKKKDFLDRSRKLFGIQ